MRMLQEYRIFDWPRHFWRGGGGLGGCFPRKYLIFYGLETLFPAFWEQFKRNINFINSDTMTIILYCSFPPILRLRAFGRTSLIRCIIKKCLCSIVVIFGRWPALLLLGYLCTHTASHFLRHCRARIMLLYIERTIQSVIELELDWLIYLVMGLTISNNWKHRLVSGNNFSLRDFSASASFTDRISWLQ
jgi:hypothetical protein